jgi:hypothetical protein
VAKGQNAAAEGGKAMGTKRKQVYVPKKPGTLAIMDQPSGAVAAEVDIPEGSAGSAGGVSEETPSDDSNKKQRRNSISRSADLAVAVDQPRLTQ